jgi:hypothetical protein
MTNPTSTRPTPHHAESSDPASYDGPKAAFIINYVPPGANCLDVAFPDIGGIGVVLSTVIQAFLTTVALIVVIYLDHSVKMKEAREVGCKKLKWWKSSLSAFIYISGDTALIYALALLISAYTNLRFTPDRTASLLHYQDAYFTLCTYMCCAFSSVHLASLLVLRDRIKHHRRTTTFRVLLLSIFGTMLIITVALSWPAFEPFFVLMDRLLVYRMKMPQNLEHFLEYFLPALGMTYIFWISVWQVLGRSVVDSRPRRKWKRVAHFLIFGSWRVVFVLQVCCAMLSICFILAQKFVTAPAPTPADRARGIGEWCSLNNPRDNQWAFSQTLAMILLLVPFYAAAEATCGMSFDVDCLCC